MSVNDPWARFVDVPISQLREEATKLSFYHSLDLGEGWETVGDFDIRPQIHRYGFPESMQDTTVLDVGRASGYFSFEFERRGAKVCSTELPDPLCKDHVGYEFGREVHRRKYKPSELDTFRAGNGARVDFFLARHILGSNVESVFTSAYDLNPEMFGGRTFDLVFMGSLLNHIANPMQALAAARSVTKRTFVICNPIDPKLDQSQPLAGFVGRCAKGLTTWWLPTIACLEEMLYAAGFSDVDVVSDSVDLLMPKNGNKAMRHCVLHARNDRPTSEVLETFIELDAGKPPQSSRSKRDGALD
jgi:tRNA (mo5U34)-methyltransferase